MLHFCTRIWTIELRGRKGSFSRFVIEKERRKRRQGRESEVERSTLVQKSINVYKRNCITRRAQRLAKAYAIGSDEQISRRITDGH
jgi:hypothetical protein